MLKINYKKYKLSILYLSGFIVLTLFVYLVFPFFFNYEQYQKILEKKIYKDFKLKISIQDKIQYRFLPSPRLKITKIYLNDFVNKKEKIAEIDKIVLRIPFKKLISVESVDFAKLEIYNAKIKIDLNQFNNYFSFFSQKFKSKQIEMLDSKIEFYEGNKYISSINDLTINYDSNNLFDEMKLNGNFLGDNILLNLKNKKDINEPVRILKLKLSNFGLVTRLLLAGAPDKQDNYPGNLLINLPNNKISFDFFYKDKIFQIPKGDIKNNFFNGEIAGNLTFFPFFKADLDIDLKSLNFRKIYNSIANLDIEEQGNILNISKKINGNFSVNASRVYSTSKIIRSFESNLELINGDIIFHKLLLDLGKIGASDIIGTISNGSKSNIFRFKQNIYVDDLKFFNNKFNIVNTNKNYEPKSIFISGILNLKKFQLRINEIFSDKKIDSEEKNFIEQNFNVMLFNQGYTTLFNHRNQKEFFKLVFDN